MLDTQFKLDELARKLSTLGYVNGDKFWIGLVFNSSSGQFEWSSGVTVSEIFMNSTCGINPNEHSSHGDNWCYLLKHINTSSPCFERRACDQKHGYGYICQTPTHNGNYSTFFAILRLLRLSKAICVLFPVFFI